MTPTILGVLGDDQRSRAASADPADDAAELPGNDAVHAFDIADDRVGSALADLVAVGQVDAAHAGLRGERNEGRFIGRRDRGAR